MTFLWRSRTIIITRIFEYKLFYYSISDILKKIYSEFITLTHL